jgi:hypothetical protein
VITRRRRSVAGNENDKIEIKVFKSIFSFKKQPLTDLHPVQSLPSVPLATPLCKILLLV